MNEIYTTIVGRVATSPHQTRLADGTARVHFRIASNERRYDAEAGGWRDGETNYVGVTCWRRLAENANTCLVVGDPVLVYGRLRVRTFEDREGKARTTAEIDATAVGPDLGFCIAKAQRPPRAEEPAENQGTEAGGDPWNVGQSAEKPPVELDARRAEVPDRLAEAGVGV